MSPFDNSHAEALRPFVASAMEAERGSWHGRARRLCEPWVNRHDLANVGVERCAGNGHGEARGLIA